MLYFSFDIYKSQLYQLEENICFQDVESFKYLEHLRKYFSNGIKIFRSASSSITRPGQIKKNHEKVSEVMGRTIYDQLWLVMNCYDQLWAFMTSYELLWLVMNCYDKLWTVMTSYDHGQLWLVIGQLKPVITRYHYLWPVWPLITLIWSVMICYD